MSLFPKILFSVICCSLVFKAGAQKDTASHPAKNPAAKKLFNKLYSNGMEMIRKEPDDTTQESALLNYKSERAFKRFEGKIIRHIVIHHYGFEQTFGDSSRINYFGTKVLNVLHTDTREWVIRDNLFFRERRPVIANKLADNERYLRTLDFIQDARIFVTSVPGSGDSVDIVVITKDLFSITGILDVGGLDNVKARLAEANFMGLGQRIQGTGVWERDRKPGTGYEFLYSKTNIGGSFVNGTIAYNTINTGRSDGTEEENAFFIKVDRPLVSPFSHVALGTEISFNNSENVHQKPDSLFLDYRYNIYDGWIGYNLGTRKLLEDENYNAKRDRVFISVRYMQTDFKQLPYQFYQKGEPFDPIYNDKKAVLAQVSFFKQDFYKLNYLYGFGTVEDVPMGYNISLTGGWHRQLNLDRPYGGIDLEQYIVTPRGGFVDAVFKAGGFYHDGRLEDASTLASVNFFTRIFHVKQWKHREYFKFSYTYLKNRIVYEPLRINNVYGLREFSTDSITGDRRISVYGESVVYANRKIFGFRFAPFLFADFSLITPELTAFRKSDIYSGLGGGVKTRNENLIFGTIELRVSYFPRKVADVSQFQVNLNSDIRFRYKTNFVKAPNIVQLNWDEL